MQKYFLIDTQILILALISPDKLSEKVLEIMREHKIYVSRISLLEIAIKQKAGSLPHFPIHAADLENRLVQDGFQILHLKTSHIASYDLIPAFAEHHDTFDRILLATALAENIPIISADERFKAYRSVLRVIGL